MHLTHSCARLPGAAGWQQHLVCAKSAAMTPPSDTAESHCAACVLVVDDDDEVRELVAETLRDCGYDVRQASSGEEALAVVGAIPSVRVVISDVRMPGMSGLDLAERVQRDRPGTKVILISGYFHPQQVSQRFLMKPFRLQELASAVRAELG
jgi:CheY-like chemotaxis protein